MTEKTGRKGEAETRRAFSASRFLLVLFLAVACLSSGCKREIRNANLRVIKEDMTTKDVESILGAPTRVEVDSELVSKEVKTLPRFRYVYVQNGEKVELTFVGDRLSSASGARSSGTPGPHSSRPNVKNDTPAISGTFSK